MIGSDIGRYAEGCNWAAAVLAKGGRAYVLDLGHATFQAGEHLVVSDFLRILKTVTLDPSSAVGR